MKKINEKNKQTLMEIRNAKYTTQKSTLFYDGDPHQIKRTCKKKCPPPQYLNSNILFVILSLHTFSYSHIVSDSLSHINSLSISLSIFLMSSYILQGLIRPIFQQLFHAFFAPIICRKMQRCLSK